MLFRECPDCRAERAFEQPPCADGHGDDCPEWVCTGCGGALLICPPMDPPVRPGIRVDQAA